MRCYIYILFIVPNICAYQCEAMSPCVLMYLCSQHGLGGHCVLRALNTFMKGNWNVGMVGIVEMLKCSFNGCKNTESLFNVYYSELWGHLLAFLVMHCGLWRIVKFVSTNWRLNDFFCHFARVEMQKLLVFRELIHFNLTLHKSVVKSDKI